MREILTGIAIVLIVILTAALAAPYFIDWNGQRGFLEARLSRALGQRVTIGGAIDLKLLPTPYLVLDQTVIGGDEGPVTIGIRHLDLELSVAPLLHGEFDIVEARLEEPTIRLTLGRDRALPALPSAPAFTADVRFDRIDVANGTLAVADPSSGRTFVFDHLDLSAEAPALAGPYKGTGSAGEGGARTTFRFATTTADNGKARLRFVAGETARHPGLDLDGAAALTPVSGGYREDFEGTLALTGHTALGATARAGIVPWRLSGPFRAGPRTATLADGELRLGAEEAGLTLRARATGDFSEGVRLALDLSAKQLDVDRLSGPPIEAVRPPPPRLPDLAGLRDALSGAAPPFATTVDLAVDTATWGGDTLSDLRAHWTTRSGNSWTLRFAVDGPGGSHLAADGALPPTARGFAGTLAASSDNLPATLAWLATIGPDVRSEARVLPAQAFGLSGHVVADGEGIEADALTARLGASTLTGTGRLTFAAAARPAKLRVDVRAKALAAETLPSMPGLRAAAASYDLNVRVAADRLTLAGDTPLTTGPVSLALTKTGGAVAITHLAATDLGGANIDGDGALDAGGARLRLAVDAARLETAAALLRRLAPGPAADALTARAPALAPAKLTIDLALSARADGGLAPDRISVGGRAGGTNVVATLAPSDEGVALNATLDAPEGGTLLRQLGAATLPLGVVGASRIAVRARGPAGQPLDTTFDASLGATKLDVAGRYDLLAAGGPSGRGTARLTSPDLVPLLQTLALAFPDVAGRVPAEIAGGLILDHGAVSLTDGNGSVAGVAGSGALAWRPAAVDAPALSGRLDLERLSLSSLLALELGPYRPGAEGRVSSERFTGGLVDPPRTALALKVKVLDLPRGPAATDASMDLGIAPNLVTLRHLTASLAGGRVAVDFALRRAASDATAEGRIALDQVRVNLPGAETVVTGALDLAGAGASPSALIASLAGSGTTRAVALSIARADPLALPKVFASLEADALAVDSDTIVRALDGAAQGPLALGDRDFTLALANGVLHVTSNELSDNSTPAPQGPVVGTVDAALDLQTFRLDEHVRETLLALPTNWTGAAPSITIGLRGPVEAPVRSVDVSALVEAVATRALARETARVEAYEFDIRERAFFSQRLQSEQRREQDRLKAEDDARKADADRRARADAARLDRLRKEDAARAAAARSEQAIRDAIQAQGAAARAAREKAIEERASGEAPPPDRSRRPEAPQDEERGSRFETPPPGATSDPAAAGRY